MACKMLILLLVAQFCYMVQVEASWDREMKTTTEAAQGGTKINWGAFLESLKGDDTPSAKKDPTEQSEKRDVRLPEKPEIKENDLKNPEMSTTTEKSEKREIPDKPEIKEKDLKDSEMTTTTEAAKKEREIDWLALLKNLKNNPSPNEPPQEPKEKTDKREAIIPESKEKVKVDNNGEDKNQDEDDDDECDSSNDSCNNNE